MKQHGMRAHDEQFAQVAIAHFRNAPEFCLPPEEFCLGVSPRKAAFSCNTGSAEAKMAASTLDIRWNFGDAVTGQTGRLFLPFDGRIRKKFSDLFNVARGRRHYPVYNFMTALGINLTFYREPECPRLIHEASSYAKKNHDTGDQRSPLLVGKRRLSASRLNWRSDDGHSSSGSRSGQWSLLSARGADFQAERRCLDALGVARTVGELPTDADPRRLARTA